jgi:hypothetical protein
MSGPRPELHSRQWKSRLLAFLTCAAAARGHILVSTTGAKGRPYPTGKYTTSLAQSPDAGAATVWPSQIGKNKIRFHFVGH